jgi:hypothetical protein
MVYNFKRGQETLTIHKEKRPNIDMINFTVERKDENGRVVARNFMSGYDSDFFNLQSEAWKNGWSNR